MKILKILHVQTSPFTEQQKLDREKSSNFLSDNRVKIINYYKHTPNILDHLTLQDEDNLNRKSLKDYVNEPGYHCINLIMTESEWKQMELSPTLFGQSETLFSRNSPNGQIITYGAWTGRVNWLRKYSKEIQEHFTEATLGELHELRHGLRYILNYHYPTTHAVFYGFEKKKWAESNARRWVRKPFVKEDWDSLPFENLYDLPLDKEPTKIVEKKPKGRNKPKVVITHHALSNKNHTVEDVDKWHKERDFPKSSLGYFVGYHYVIEADGTITQTREDDEEGAHTLGMNTSSIGVCFMGNFNTHLPTKAQTDAWIELYDGLRQEYSNIPTKPHRAYADRTCHGTNLSDEYFAHNYQKWTLMLELKRLLVKLISKLWQK